MTEIPPGRWYQEATINGVAMPTRRKQDTNEIRWQTFIEPLLPYQEGDGRIFLELGCNAGFYLRKATDLGFKAQGIEREPEFIAHARYWEANDPLGVKIIKGDLNLLPFPAASVVLLANVHYWLTRGQFEKLVRRLRKQALYVIVIGRHHARPEHASRCDKTALINRFAGWNNVKSIDGSKHFSVLFQNPKLCEKTTEELLNQELIDTRVYYPAYRKLVQAVMTGGEITPDTTKYWNYLFRRKARNIPKLFNRGFHLIESVLEHGITTPIALQRGEIIDGNHRIITAHTIGLKWLICQDTN